jgi:hypothetical protein
VIMTSGNLGEAADSRTRCVTGAGSVTESDRPEPTAEWLEL